MPSCNKAHFKHLIHYGTYCTMESPNNIFIKNNGTMIIKFVYNKFKKLKIYSSLIQYIQTIASPSSILPKYSLPHLSPRSICFLYLFRKEKASKSQNKIGQNKIQQDKAKTFIWRIDKATQQEEKSRQSRQKSHRYTCFHCQEYHKLPGQQS